jgi:hypothetical protein
VPAQEALSAKLLTESSTDAEPTKIRIGNTDYDADQLVSQDLGKMFKKGDQKELVFALQEDLAAELAVD